LHIWRAFYHFSGRFSFAQGPAVIQPENDCRYFDFYFYLFVFIINYIIFTPLTPRKQKGFFSSEKKPIITLKTALSHAASRESSKILLSPAA